MVLDIFAKEIYLEDEILKDSYVTVKDGIIIGIGKEKRSNEVIDLSDSILTPGFLDIHVHGGNGYDTMDGKAESIQNISLYKLREGVTSFCPTTVTASTENTVRAIEVVKQSIGKVEGAKIIGTFLEGPYISKDFKGAHPENFIKQVDLSEIKKLVEVGQGTIKSVALAPETTNGSEVINYLKSQDINIRIGHSSATYEQTNEAVKNGCNIAIHVYNAMKGFTHREPGMVGAVLTNENIFGEVIIDMVHVHGGAIKLLLKCKGPDKTILITDCMMAGGMKDGEYNLGELTVIVKDKIARTLSGALAGSTLSIDKAIKNLLTLGFPLYEAVKMATVTPAKALNIYNEVGSIRVGKKADFVGMNELADISFVMVDGIRKI